MSPSTIRLLLFLGAAQLVACSGSPTGTGNPGAVAVAVEPLSAQVAPLGTAPFQAIVTGSADTQVIWSVQEGSPGGAVSAVGLYTAPSASGTFHVVATSHADASKSGTATVTVTGAGAMGPLKVSSTNSRYFVDPSGNPVLLVGSHTWNTFQDLSQSSSVFPAFDFNAYITFLQSHGHNVTILWRKDLPTFYNWGAGGTWHIANWPWLRTGPGTADDGLPKFDLTQLDQTYFDRLRARALLLQQAGMYVIVQLFDGLQLVNNRNSASDGYPFSGPNNVNGVADDNGTSSMDLSNPTITGYQDAYVKKVIDTLNDLDNVLWEPSEEAPTTSDAWNNHMISLIHTYEAGKPLQHPVGYAVLQNLVDGPQFSSAAEWVAVAARVSPTNNQGKVVINDSDHSYFNLWLDSQQTNRNYVWENFCNGSQALFMDPYLIYWSSGNRNLCASPSNGVCTDVVHGGYLDNMRQNLGYTLTYARKMNLLAMTPQPSLSSTGYCLANVSASAHELLVYAPSGGTFTVNLSGASGTIAVEWFNPATGTTTAGPSVSGGSQVTFTAPTGSGDAVLYLK